jgi:hypothetical protein
MEHFQNDQKWWEVQVFSKRTKLHIYNCYVPPITKQTLYFF